MSGRPKSRTLTVPSGAKVRTQRKQRWVAVADVGGGKATVLRGSKDLHTVLKFIGRHDLDHWSIRGIDEITVFDMNTGEQVRSVRVAPF